MPNREVLREKPPIQYSINMADRKNSINIADIKKSIEANSEKNKFAQKTQPKSNG
jgi:hypothetical protein